MSYDDLGLHHPDGGAKGGQPRWIHTPNMDRFVAGGSEYSNFYVAPQCAQSRAQLLTGRSYPKTGTLDINGARQAAGLRVASDMCFTERRAGLQKALAAAVQMRTRDPSVC